MQLGIRKLAVLVRSMIPSIEGRMIVGFSSMAKRRYSLREAGTRSEFVLPQRCNDALVTVC